MWWKKHKWKLLLPLALAGVLALAFWYGGDAPGSRGWSVRETPAVSSASPQSPMVSAPAASPALSMTPALPSPSAPAASPAEVSPDPSPSPSPSSPSAEEGGGLVPSSPPPPASEVPEAPEEDESGQEALACTLSISCATILEHMDWLEPGKEDQVPQDGWILETTSASFEEGESVLDVLQRVCRREDIHMEFENTPMYQSAYIQGIHNLYQFDCGELSGWMYKVNGQFPNYGCSRYQLRDGDAIEWVYTCDLGTDVGGGVAQQG